MAVALFQCWQPTCLRGLQRNRQKGCYLAQELATHLPTRIATVSRDANTHNRIPGNPLAYEDCNCKIFVICECYSTKDLLSYGGKCKKYLHGAKALDLISITFYYRTNSP